MTETSRREYQIELEGTTIARWHNRRSFLIELNLYEREINCFILSWKQSENVIQEINYFHFIHFAIKNPVNEYWLMLSLVASDIWHDNTFRSYNRAFRLSFVSCIEYFYDVNVNFCLFFLFVSLRIFVVVSWFHFLFISKRNNWPFNKTTRVSSLSRLPRNTVKRNAQK